MASRTGWNPRTAVPLAGGDEQGQRPLSLLDRQVQLRGQPVQVRGPPGFLRTGDNAFSR
ncbi:hypothetical protein [Streptomyces erythrochromogenes]|uniref:hypothetical protein n=1 Tax=Streptomyces erythrochromogenes TaxID=285574 RepID=UPI0036C2FBA6